MQNKLSSVVIGLATCGLVCGMAAAQTSSTPAQSGSSAASAAAKPATTARKTTTASKAAPGVLLKTQKDKESYALGMKIGSDLKRQGVGASVEGAMVARGLKDLMTGSKTAMTEDDMKKLLTQLQGEVQEKREADVKTAGAENRKEGDAFLAANKTKDGVVALPSGLQYKILKEGTGAKPTTTDTVTCNYRGTLINGKEFDSSYKRGEPASFPVNGVIKGWTEALQLMPVGSKWELFIPPDLAYGDRGAGADIGPDATLIFEVELLSIGEPKSDQKK